MRLLIVDSLTAAKAEIHVLHVGNNWAYKNVDGAIAICIQLQERLADKRVVFERLGDPLRDEQLARLQAHDVQFVQKSAASAEDLAATYASADLFVFPSLYEGFGWPPLEAMAAGTPAVISSNGSLAEISGGGAYVVLNAADQMSSAECDKVADLFAEDRWQQASDQAHAFAQLYQWQTTAQKTVDIYREILQGKP